MDNKITYDIKEASGYLEDSLASRLLKIHPGVLRDHPVERYIELLDGIPEVAGYSSQSPDIGRFCEWIRDDVSDAGLEIYHQLLLVRLIERARLRLPDAGFPARIVDLYEENFRRITRNIVRQMDPPGFYTHPEFSKELGVCSLRFIPCGVFKLHLHGIPRGSLIDHRPRRLIKACRLSLFELRGLKPLFEGHLDSRDSRAMLDFNRDGWVRAFRLIAELLLLRPGVRGFYGASWLHDPQLKQISPNLGFIPDLVEEIGGAILAGRRCGPEGIRDATYLSPHRQKLFNEGRYIPRNFLLVLPRGRLIAWARRLG